jgi:coenzyme F420-reducing hydrogenase beta subunit
MWLFGKRQVIGLTIMGYVCASDRCTGCKACLETCKVGALSFVDNAEYVYVKIDETKCVRCNICKKVCQVNNPVDLSKPILWKQGWGEESERRSSSSGGLAAQIMKSFVGKDAYVCSCIFRDGEFKYYLTNKKDELAQYKGSKYVKSNPGNVYSIIKKVLLGGSKVLFIGLPCHVAALKRLLSNEQKQLLYTIDLICHGTPSVKILSRFLFEYNIDINNINSIMFRGSDYFNISINSKEIVPRRVIDQYTLGFLRGLFYTDNCYYCRYAQIQRVSDLTLGDSWGTDLKEQEEYGISLALCQTEKGVELIKDPQITLFDVDLQTAVRGNHQLREPSKCPDKRKVFFDEYRKNGSVKKAVFKCYPDDCIKQTLKGFLIKHHILGMQDSI